jgi:hypothetical protein
MHEKVKKSEVFITFVNIMRVLGMTIKPQSAISLPSAHLW